MKEYKNMRKYSHEEFVELIKNLSEEELIELSNNYGGYPVLIRMALDERVCHIPFIQTGSAVIIINELNQILLQERTDRNTWSVPGGCQNLGEELIDTAVRETKEETGIKLNKEDLVLIDTVSSIGRKNVYPNGDIVYNNTSLYFVKLDSKSINLNVSNDETKRLEFFNLDKIPNCMDKDLIEVYVKWANK